MTCASMMFYVGPALVKSTNETAAVMATFDEYSSLLQSSINPFVFIPKCVSYGILSGDIMLLLVE